MAERTIRAGIVTYHAADGREGVVGFQGETVDVHEGDLERFDRLNPAAHSAAEAVALAADGLVQAIGAAVTEALRAPGQPEPSENWKKDELIAYASEHALDISDASTKADILAVIHGAASAPDEADGDQPPADGDSQE